MTAEGASERAGTSCVYNAKGPVGGVALPIPRCVSDVDIDKACECFK